MSIQQQSCVEAMKAMANYIDVLGGDSKKYRQAIAEAEKQEQGEPVAWRVSYPNEPELGFWFAEGIGGEGCLNEPLYTTPQQRTWVGLTEEEIEYLDMETSGTVHDFVYAIEAKLREKNSL